MNHTFDIYFSIRSNELSPEHISRLLGLAPSFSCIKGSQRREGQSLAKENVWSMKVSKSDQLGMGEQVQLLVDVLQPFKKKLIGISEHCYLDVECIVNVHEGSTTPTINFKADVARFFGEIGADLGVEVYF